VNEDALIAKLRRHAPLIGDDCAVVPSPAGKDLLFTTDFTIEGVHFKRDALAAEVGYKALARGLSDIAAMGGTPLYCLVSMAVAAWTDQRWIDGFYRGLHKLLRQSKTSLAGGDISHAKEFVCDVLVCGWAPKGKALLRSGALPGDVIYVSRPLGGWRHKRIVMPRLHRGRKLIGKATACIDISDGLALDLHRLALTSGVAAAIDSVPLLPGATLKQALHDGEDYELLYTAPPRKRVPGFRIGVIMNGKPGSVTYQGRPVPQIGYDHFQHRS
jgi:thiamine-monophosphate kinase